MRRARSAVSRSSSRPSQKASASSRSSSACWPSSSRASDREGEPIVALYAVVSAVGGGAVRLAAEGEPLFQINIFQVVIAAANFVVFLVLMYQFAFKPISSMLAERRERIEQGLKDAEQAKRD